MGVRDAGELRELPALPPWSVLLQRYVPQYVRQSPSARPNNSSLLCNYENYVEPT